MIWPYIGLCKKPARHYFRSNSFGGFEEWVVPIFCWHLHFWVVGGALPNGKAKNQGLENTQICDTVWLYFAHKMVKEPIHHMPRHGVLHFLWDFQREARHTGQSGQCGVGALVSCNASQQPEKILGGAPSQGVFKNNTQQKTNTNISICTYTHTHEITFNT